MGVRIVVFWVVTVSEEHPGSICRVENGGNTIRSYNPDDYNFIISYSSGNHKYIMYSGTNAVRTDNINNIRHTLERAAKKNKSKLSSVGTCLRLYCSRVTKSMGMTALQASHSLPAVVFPS